MPARLWRDRPVVHESVLLTKRLLFSQTWAIDYEHRQTDLWRDRYMVPQADLERFLNASQEEFSITALPQEIADAIQDGTVDTTRGQVLIDGDLTLDNAVRANARPNTRYRRITTNGMAKRLKPFLEHWGVRSVIVVDMNIDQIRVFGFKRFFRSNKPFWNYKHFWLQLPDQQTILQHYWHEKNFALLSKKMPDDWHHNTIMNILSQFPAKVTDDSVTDIIRATYTNLLLEIYGKFSLSEFGLHTPQAQEEQGDFPLVILTGEVPAMLQDYAISALMLLDGFQLSGMMYLHVDIHNSFKQFLYAARPGFIVPAYQLLDDHVDLMISPSTQFPLPTPFVVSLGSKKHALPVGEISRYSLKDTDSITFEGKHLPSIEWKAVQERLTVAQWSTLTVDLRRTPVKYGPTPEENMTKVPEWYNGLRVIHKK